MAQNVSFDDNMQLIRFFVVFKLWCAHFFSLFDNNGISNFLGYWKLLIYFFSNERFFSLFYFLFCCLMDVHQNIDILQHKLKTRNSEKCYYKAEFLQYSDSFKVLVNVRTSVTAYQ